jgi:hypothetical protein
VAKQAVKALAGPSLVAVGQPCSSLGMSVKFKVAKRFCPKQKEKKRKEEERMKKKKKNTDRSISLTTISTSLDHSDRRYCQWQSSQIFFLPDTPHVSLATKGKLRHGLMADCPITTESPATREDAYKHKHAQPRVQDISLHVYFAPPQPCPTAFSQFPVALA